MPELPEVEVVRRGLEEHVVGRTVADVVFSGHRVTRRHVLGPADLVLEALGVQVRLTERLGQR